eukprot:3711688-Rhodomonas_salina.1
MTSKVLSVWLARNNTSKRQASDLGLDRSGGGVSSLTKVSRRKALAPPHAPSALASRCGMKLVEVLILACCSIIPSSVEHRASRRMWRVRR